MDKNKILENIENGVQDYYLNEDFKLDQKEGIEESIGDYPAIAEKYIKLAKKVLFQAEIEANKSKISNVISIGKAKGKLKSLDSEFEGKVFSLFKRHIEEYGLAVNYRNFESMSKAEMTNILEQINFTKLLNDLESELEDE